MPETMHDLLVVVPGILGTELRRNNEVVWGQPEGIRRYLQMGQTLTTWVEALHMGQDHGDPFKLLGDIEPSRLIEMPQIVAKFFKADGYDSLRQFLFRKFRLQSGQPGQEQPDNYMEFPYDWRRDCRINAVRLKHEVEDKLKDLRNENPDAQAIFICHSMGGLVTKHYLDLLNGWNDCKALITLGTPYKGSLNAVDSICNGFDVLGVEFDEVLRSFEGVYQLLPTYGVVDIDEDDYLRVDHPNAQLPNLDAGRANNVIENFYGKMNHVRRDETERIYAFAGDNMDTLQSGQVRGASFSPSNWVHHRWPAYKQTGDGTVPIESSIPPEFNNDPRGVYRAGSAHAVLQSDVEVQKQIFRILAMLQDRALRPTQAMGQRANLVSSDPKCELMLKNVYEQQAEIQIQLKTERLDLEDADLNVRLASYDGHEVDSTVQQTNDGWVVNAHNLLPGVYKIHARVFSFEQEVPPAMQDIFEVAEAV